MVKDTAEHAAKEAVRQTLLTLGIDTQDPIEVQADMRHLREWRKSVATVKKQSLMTAIAILTSGMIGVIWLALTSKSGG
ncbi:hypothetical protein KWJ32_15275 [Brucella sp. BTU2]|nr:hypothetical protein [Ochrobactrum sp. BTU2]